MESTSGSIVTGVLKVLSARADIEPIGISSTSEMGHQTISGLAKVSETPDTSSVSCIKPADEQQRRRETQLRQHSFFELRVHLISGHGLVAMDKSGTLKYTVSYYSFIFHYASTFISRYQRSLC